MLVLAMQVVAIPPHAHDLHQIPEHAIGYTKGHITETIKNMDGSVKKLSHADLQQMVREGASKYTANNWMDNMHRLVQCLRLISTPAEQ